MPAPIALFTYNRPNHTRRTLEALKANPLAAESDLFLFSDGPKKEADLAKVLATRELLKSVTGFKSVTLSFQEQNRGLANSIISGVTEVVNRFGSVVVLEDDLVTSPGFLRYMNDGLESYKTDERVISIHGYVYPTREPLPETFFLKGADCWGWATWKRGWDLFEPDGKKLQGDLKSAGLNDRFDFGGAYPYTGMLEDQIGGRNDSWAVRWYASALLHDKFTLYPGRSLVSNIGTDGGGSHMGKTDSFDVGDLAAEIRIQSIPVKDNLQAYLAFAEFFRRLTGNQGGRRIPGWAILRRLARKGCDSLLRMFPVSRNRTPHKVEA